MEVVEALNKQRFPMHYVLKIQEYHLTLETIE